MTAQPVSASKSTRKLSWHIGSKSKRLLTYTLIICIPFLATYALDMQDKTRYAAFISMFNTLAMMVFYIQFPLAGRFQNKIFNFSAKTVVLCTGSGGFKPNGFPMCDLTHDSTIMAYNIGAKVTGKEWNDGHPASAENSGSCYDNWHGQIEEKTQCDIRANKSPFGCRPQL